MLQGVWHSCPTTRNEAVDMSGMGNVAGFLYLQLYIFIYIYIYMWSRLWTHKSRSWGGPILYCFFNYTVNVYCDYTPIYFYKCTFFMSTYRWCFCTSDAFHIRIRNDCSEQVCVCVRVFFTSSIPSFYPENKKP